MATDPEDLASDPAFLLAEHSGAPSAVLDDGSSAYAILSCLNTSDREVIATWLAALRVRLDPLPVGTASQDEIGRLPPICAVRRIEPPSAPRDVILPAVKERIVMSWLDKVRKFDFDAIPGKVSFEEASELALMIEGYEVSGGHTNCMIITRQVVDNISTLGAKPETALNIWIALFGLQRSYRFCGLTPDDD